MTWHLAACNDKASADALATATAALGWDITRLHRGDRLLHTIDGMRGDIPDGVIAAMEEHATNYATVDEASDVSAWIAANYVGDEPPS